MQKLFINDASFSHSTSSSWYHKPENFEWTRTDAHLFDTVFTTNLFASENYIDKKIYGWLIEPSTLIPKQYEYAINNQNKFHKIFTYDKKLLNISNKFELLPIGGCWIEEEERKIYKKNKLASTIISSKNELAGHKLRHEAVKKIKNIDIFGFHNKELPIKIDALKDYMFSIVIENEKMDYLFTEKIIDCFATGTIPIYWGCPSIGDFFDIEGILIFDNINELIDIINKINIEFYSNKLKAIQNNFELCKKYMIADNLIYNSITNKQ
jgi:hypothetical protein